MFKNLGLQFKISAVILLPLLIMMIISSLINIMIVNDELETQASIYLKQSVEAQAANAENVLKTEYNYLKTFASSVSDLYNVGIRSRDSYSELIDYYILNMPESMTGVALIFENNILDNDADYINDALYSSVKGQFGFYKSKNGSGNVATQSISDADLKADYNTVPKQTRKDYITSIYNYKVNGQDVKMYTWAIPIIDKNNNYLGVVTADVSTSDIIALMESIKPYPQSEVILFDTAGRLVYSRETNIDIETTLYDLFPSQRDSRVLENTKQGVYTEFSTYSALFKEKSIYVTTPITMLDNYNWGIEIVTPSSVILKNANNIRNIMVAISVLILLIIFIITPIIIKLKVSVIIKALANNMISLSEGDLTIAPPPGFTSRKDEWGDIARGWEVSMKNVNEVLYKVMSSAEYVTSAANEVKQGTFDLSLRTEKQASSLEETASSMNEIASTIKESTSNVYESNNMLIEAKGYLTKAGMIVSNSVEKMDDVYESSSKIMDITKIIEGIAFQTNILALNASVEAARAGDQGRGFAVVASEVRNLAQNTQDSVKNITELITDSNEKIHLAAESVKESQEIFVELSNKMDTVSQLMEQINTSAQEQQSGVEQINMAINNMEASLQHNAALVEQTTATSETLLNEAKGLKTAIDYFKLKSN